MINIFKMYLIAVFKLHLWNFAEDLEKGTDFAEDAASSVPVDDHDLEEVGNEVGDAADVLPGRCHAGYVEQNVKRYCYNL